MLKIWAFLLMKNLNLETIVLNYRENVILSVTKLFSKLSPKEYFDLFKIYVRPILD